MALKEEGLILNRRWITEFPPLLMIPIIYLLSSLFNEGDTKKMVIILKRSMSMPMIQESVSEVSPKLL